MPSAQGSPLRPCQATHAHPRLAPGTRARDQRPRRTRREAECELVKRPTRARDSRPRPMPATDACDESPRPALETFARDRRQVGCLVGCLVGSLVGRLVACLVCGRVGCLVVASFAALLAASFGNLVCCAVTSWAALARTLDPRPLFRHGPSKYSQSLVNGVGADGNQGSS